MPYACLFQMIQEFDFTYRLVLYFALKIIVFYFDFFISFCKDYYISLENDILGRKPRPVFISRKSSSFWLKQ